MTQTWFLSMCGTAVIGCGLISGIFLAFSDFIMRSLKHSKPSAGIEVMQIINIEVWKSVFMALLWGFLVITVGLAIYANLTPSEPTTIYTTVGAVLYLIGVFGISFGFNIPMNNRLAVLDFTSPQATEYWIKTYLPRWTFWNYLRAIASGGSAICFLITSVQLAYA